MKLFNLLFFIFIYSRSISAQHTPTELWQAVEYAKSVDIRGPIIELDKFQNTYMLTNQTDASPLGGIKLVKYDTLGNVLWKRNSPPGIIGIYYGSFTVDSIGNAYISLCFDGGLPGYDADAILLKYSPNGDLLWDTNYGLNQAGDSYIYYTEFDTINDRLITLGMNLHDTIPSENFMFVQAIDTSDGSVIWKTKIGGVFRPQNMRIQADYIQLLSTKYGSDSKYFMNTRLNLSGVVLDQFEKRYSGYAIDFNYISKTGDVIFGNRALGYNVTKVNIEGDTLWRYGSSGIVLENWVRSIIEDDSLNIYITGSSLSNGDDFDFSTTKLQKGGTLIWEEKFGIVSGNFDTGNKLFIADSLVFAIGAAETNDDTTKMVVKVYNLSGEEKYSMIIGDKLINSGEDIVCKNNKLFFTGYRHENTSTSVEILTGSFKLPAIISSIKTSKELVSVRFSPNPSTDNISINNIDQKVFKKLLMYDISGNIILSKNIIDDQMSISMSEFPSGIYMLFLNGENISISKKIIKI